MNRRGTYDIPLKRDAAARFLPWIIALMVYLATLALATSMALSDMAARWDSGLTGSLTIQVTPLSTAGAAPVADRVDAVLSRLAQFPGVADARALPREETLALVEPWLGSAALVQELPVPALIDVTLDPRADIAGIRDTLESSVPGVSVEDPGTWLSDLRGLAATVQWVAAAIVLLIGGAAVAAVIFAASAGFAVHRGEVELLHVLGASDGYVAGQFQRHVLRLTMIGGGAGAVLAIVTLLVFARAAAGLEAALLPSLSLSPVQWAALLSVPVLAAALAAVTARMTVMRALERLP